MEPDELTQGVPEGQPEQPAAPEAPADQEYVDLRNRDENWRVPKDQFQQFADSIGWDPERLKESLEIGSDGRQLYSRLDEERERLQQEAEQVRAIQAQYEAAMRQVQQQPRQPQYGPPQQPQGFVPRPPEQDVTGNVLWAASALERLAPLLERIPEIERNQGFINQQIQRRDEAIDMAEERATALRAYQETQEVWKKEYGVDPPTQRELEAYLRKFPISDDVDMTWQEVWNAASWMLKGPSVYRHARRQAVLDAQKPGARITVPINTGLPSAPPSLQSTGDPDQDFQRMAQSLGKLTLQDIQGAG